MRDERDRSGAEFAARRGAKRWHADWRDLLRDDDVDAVYVATPVNLHAEQAVAAAEAGKHVLREKPMALTPAQCERMLAAARASASAWASPTIAITTRSSRGCAS